jgi:hypothetical protein
VSPLVGVSKQPLLAIEHRYAPPLEFGAAAMGKGPHFFTVTAVGYGSAWRKLGEESKPRSVAALQTTILKVFVW